MASYTMMWRGVRRFLLFVIILTNLTQGQEGFMAILSPVRDFISSQSVILSFERIPTTGQCFNKCLREDSCLSFFFDPEERFCQIHSVVFQKDSFWERRNGTKYYQRIFPKACGSLDYVYHPPTSMCYKIYSDITLKQPDALIYCQQDGGSLISLQSFDKFWHTREAVMTFPQFYSTAVMVLIGAIKDGNSWKWATGETLPFSSPIWSRGRPFNDSIDRLYGGFRGNFDFYIIDGLKSRWSYFICERNVSG